MTPETAILVGAALATAGWLYTGRRQRNLARKQHTINIMLQASFNKEFQEALTTVAPFLRARSCPDLFDSNNEPSRLVIRKVLNHYEFVAAGIRNGDIDEILLRDSERATIVCLAEICHDYIYGLRSSRQRQTIYEHLEWLHRRWTTRPPARTAQAVEWFRGKPFQGQRVRLHD